MSVMRFSLVVLLCSAVFGGDTRKETEELSLELNVLRQQVSLGDDVDVTVELHSVGQSSVWLPMMLEAGVNLDVLITGPSGMPVRHMTDHRKYAPLPRESFIRLAAGHYLGRKMSIASFHFEDRGTYTLQMVYSARDDGSEAAVNAWTGMLRSGEIHVSVQ